MNKFWYAAILSTVAIATIVIVIMLLAGGAAALTQLCGLPWWAALVIFALALGVWIAPKKRP